MGFATRHLGVQNFICRMLTQAHIPHDREVDVNSSGRRPADILLKAWEDDGKDCAVDLTVIHLCPPAQGRFPPGTAARLAANAEDHKRRESEGLCNAVGTTFTPMVMDAWGGLHGEARALWRKMAARCTARTTIACRSAVIGLLRQGLAVATVRAVAAQLEHLEDVTPETPAWWTRSALPGMALDDAGNDIAWA